MRGIKEGYFLKSSRFPETNTSLVGIPESGTPPGTSFHCPPLSPWTGRVAWDFSSVRTQKVEVF